MFKPLRILFMGSPAAAVPCLDFLQHSQHQVLGVVTQPDRAQGRGKHVQACPVAARARELNLPLWQPEKLREATPDLLQLKPDLILVVAYGKLLKRDLLELAPHGCWNVHFSLLPKYRGAAPYQWAILQGETEAGISIIRLVEELDAGPILYQATTPILPEETSGQLLTRLAPLGAQTLGSALQELEAGTLQAREQDHGQATYAPQLNKQAGLLDWSQSATVLANRIRAFNPWPSAFTYLIGEKEPLLLKIHRAHSVPQHGKPGTVLSADPKRGLVIACGQAALMLDEVQPAGKRSMDSADFSRGHSLRVGTQLHLSSSDSTA